MRKFLALLALPLVLSSCSLSADSRFASITDGKSFVEFMIPRNREIVRLSAQVMAINQEQPKRAAFRQILLTRNAETRDMQRAYRSWTNTDYPMTGISPSPIANLDGLAEADATRTYLEAVIKAHEEAIDASRYAKKTGTGTTMNVLADMVIANRDKEVKQLREFLEGK